MPKPLFTLPFGAARVATATLTALMFFIMLYACGVVLLGGLGNDPVVPEHGGWLAAIFLSCVPFFAGQSAFVSFPDAYALGFFRVPEATLAELTSEALQRGVTNPWAPALWAFGLVGVPVGLLAVWLAPSLPRELLTVSNFVLVVSTVGALMAGGTLLALNGRHFLREAAVPREARAYRGSASAYLWTRHVLPQALLNLWLNAWVAPALIKGRFDAETSGITRDALVADTFATGLVLAVAIGMGTLAYVRFDQRWHVAPKLPGPALPGWQNAMLVAGSPLPLALLVSGALTALSIEQVGSWTFTCARGALWGTYAAAIAFVTGRWALRTPDKAFPRSEPGATLPDADADLAG